MLSTLTTVYCLQVVSSERVLKLTTCVLKKQSLLIGCGLWFALSDSSTGWPFNTVEYCATNMYMLNTFFIQWYEVQVMSGVGVAIH